MKNIYIKLSIIFLTVFNFLGCSDYLDTESKSFWKDEDFYSTEEEANLALNGIYSQLAHDDIYGWKFNVLMEGGTDESYTNDPSNTWSSSKYSHTASNDEIKNVWLKFYTCIQLANQFEKNLKPSLFNSEEFNSLLARARFMRAFCYFNLANWFGPVPLRLTPSYSQEDNHLAPSPVFDIYNQVERDFLFATKHLVHTSSSNYLRGEPNKMAAHGMLARLYLKMGGYQPYLAATEADSYFDNKEQYFVKAQKQCEIVINDGYHGITPFTADPESYRNHFLNYLQDDYDLQESLFEISFGNLEEIGIHVSGRLGNINGVEFVGTLDIPRGFCKINAAIPLYNIYSSEDTRRAWNIAGYRNKYSNNTQSFNMSYIFDMPLHQEYGPGKFRRWEPRDIETLAAESRIENAEYTILNNTSGSATDANFTSINFPILRYADVLLMHAEAIIGGRFGTTDATATALNDLNIIKERAGLEPYTGSLVHDDFFEELIDERLRELCFEGLRKQDLIRWRLLESKLSDTNDAIMSHETYDSSNQFHQTFLEAGNNFDSSKHYLLPYPLQEVQINNLLEQRIGW